MNYVNILNKSQEVICPYLGCENMLDNIIKVIKGNFFETIQNKKYMVWLVAIAFVFLGIPCALGAQLPLPVDSVSKSGAPSWSLQTGDWIGDRGSWTREAFADFDADGDYDMLVGTDNGMIEYWRNDGNASSAVWVLGNSNLLGDVGDYTAPNIIDFDGDGDFDIITGANDGYFRYYKNIGTQTNPSFIYQRAWLDGGDRTAPAMMDYNNDGNYDLVYGRSDQYIYKYKNDVDNSGFFMDDFAMDDVGAYSSPVYVDIDSDHDYDLFVGNSEGKVYFYKNTGTVNSPAWAEEVYLFDVGDYAVPAFADFDNDGDLDMLVGCGDGTFKYYRNDGTPTTPYWVYTASWFTADVGDRAAPAISDIDNDGDFDIIIGNSAGIINYYRNTGSAAAASFDLTPINLVGDIGDNSHPFLADLDADNDYDMAIGRSDGYILYYRNNGTETSPSFVSAGNLIGDSYDYSAPAIADIDNDGDKDIASGTEGGWVAFYENKGSAASFRFSTEQTYWLDNLQRYSSHDYIDFDHDGDLDLIMGREDGYILYYRNDGTAQRPVWTYVRNWIGYWGSWTAPAMADINNDGDIDLAFGRADDAYISYFENDASESSVNWTRISTDMIGDVGDSADPAFADLDADGDLDMVVGNSDGYVQYFRNSGSAANPNWTLVTANLIGDAGSWASPTLGDIDGDGDYDMVLGVSDDAYLRYYRNDGNATYPSWTYVSSNWLGSCSYPSGCWQGQYATPEFVDLDTDGDLDLAIGSYYYGDIYYWRNDGTPAVPAWVYVGVLAGIGGSDQRTSPTFADIDKDGDPDMVVGSRYGTTYYYKNEGKNASYSFQYIYAGDGGYQWINNIGSDTYIKPAFADLDGDGDADLIYGLYNGLLYHYRNDGLYTSNASKGSNPTWIYRSGNWLGNYIIPGDSSFKYGTPEFADLDADGDLDLVIGTPRSGNSGYLRYWRNDGSPTEPIWTYVGDMVGNLGDVYPDPTLGDIDGDGDYDMLVGISDGTVKYYKNIGTPKNPSWQYVYAGDAGISWIPDVGDYARPELVDIDNDGRLDLSVADNNGDLWLRKNKGHYTTKEDKADNPTWVYDNALFTIYNSYGYGVPAFGDIDGDGDLDLAAGSTYGQVHYYRNDGGSVSPSYTFVTNWMDVGLGYYSGPAFADIDGDGDLDLAVGNQDGFIYYYKNTGTYETATTLTLSNTSGSPVQNATVIFSDATGIVCEKITDTAGSATCGNITYAGGWGRINVTNAAAGTVHIAVFSPGSKGSTSITLDNPSSDFVIELKRFQFNTYSADNKVSRMSVEAFDSGKRVFTGWSDAKGFVDGYLPYKYLVNMREPYTQNRITYDITFDENTDYASALELKGVYVPNEINISSPADAGKLCKFIVTHEMSTDANYKGYIIYPALETQRNFGITDLLPGNFSYTGNIVVEYLGKYNGSTVSPAGSSFDVNYTTPGFDFLSNQVTGKGDWLKVEFTVRTPSLDSFIINGWTGQNYIFPAASLNLTG
jgi:hypothetical protein